MDAELAALDMDLSYEGDLSRFNNVVDVHGNTPLAYATGTANFVTPEGEWHTQDTGPAHMRMYVATCVCARVCIAAPAYADTHLASAGF